MTTSKGLIIASPFVERILSGTKTWDMRTTSTKIRGRIALIRKGSGLIVGTAELVDSIGPLTQDQMLATGERHRIEHDRVVSGAVDKWRYAWVLRDIRVLARPVPYVHPSGAVIWVSLDDAAQARLNES